MTGLYVAVLTGVVAPLPSWPTSFSPQHVTVRARATITTLSICRFVAIGTVGSRLTPCGWRGIPPATLACGALLDSPVDLDEVEHLAGRIGSIVWYREDVLPAVTGHSALCFEGGADLARVVVQLDMFGVG